MNLRKNVIVHSYISKIRRPDGSESFCTVRAESPAAALLLIKSSLGEQTNLKISKPIQTPEEGEIK